jgi:hypothetical protein
LSDTIIRAGVEALETLAFSNVAGVIVSSTVFIIVYSGTKKPWLEREQTSQDKGQTAISELM